MQPGLNELLLWHGTSKDAAEKIAEDQRTGITAAMCSSLGRKASLWEMPATDGVLGMAATCGHIYYTEKDWDSGADEPAKRSGCSCVLANPGKKGPREYILFDQAQVYPEYIVEIKRD
eukprot:Skav236096  [mRNA]  locus=scaffold1166:154116:155165:+ [translate_table: standard]